MKKTLSPILFLTAILLAACSKTNDPSLITEPAAEEIVEGQETAVAQDGPFTDADEPCKPFSFVSQQFGDLISELPPISEDDLSVGPDNAAVTFIEYSQLTCPACASFEPLLVAIQEQYPDDVRLVYRHFLFQDKSEMTAQALEAAGKQGKFNEFKNYMFDRRSKSAENPEHATLPDDAFWGSVAEDDLDAWLEAHIIELGIETTQFFEDMYSTEIVEKIQATSETANILRLNSTPTLFINGYLWSQEVPRDFGTLSVFVQMLKAQESEYDECPPEITQPNIDYFATISTTKGDIVVDLYEELAPYAVNSFMFLAQEGWYDNLTFFVTNELVLSGDPSDTSYGGPGYAFLDEISGDQSLENIGKLVTFSLAPGVNGSTFFINKNGLEGQSSGTIFGEVTEGMDVLNALELRQDIFVQAVDRILSVTINEK